MLFSIIAPALLVCGFEVFAAPTADLILSSTPSKYSLQWAGPPSPIPQLEPAFTATIDWDLDDNHTIETQSGTRISTWAHEYFSIAIGYWYDMQGPAIRRDHPCHRRRHYPSWNQMS